MIMAMKFIRTLRFGSESASALCWNFRHSTIFAENIGTALVRSHPRCPNSPRYRQWSEWC